MLTAIHQDKKSANDNPFAKKWREIEKKQKRNLTQKNKIDKLFQTFQEDILPEEKKLVELLAQETRHLITFLPRKSFTQWQREELQEWIESNLSTLSVHPFGDQQLFSEVSKEYGDYLVQEAQNLNQDVEFSADDIARMREMSEEMFQGEKDFTDEELIAFMRDPSIFQQALREFMAEMESREDDFFEEDDEPFSQYRDDNANDEYQNGYQKHYAEQQSKKNNKLKALFNSSNLNKIYKILANKLHPDKETNQHLKAEKSSLMATLVKAKKDKDAFTLISMFHQFVPESELNFFDGNDNELNQALVTLLNEKLHELDEENSHQKYDDGIQSMIWQKLGGRGKKVIQENINAHLADLEDSHTRLKYYIDEVKTVKLLKEALSERYEQKHFNPFANGNFSLDDLDELFR